MSTDSLVKAKMRSLVRIAAVLAIWATVLPSYAAPRALLIGVGDYLLPDADLPGIDLDLDAMTDAAQLMGFDAGQIRRLYNQEATLDNVLRVANSWLREGVTAEDPVLLYFSGHGTRIPDLDGDELEDGADEALLMQDAQRIPATGERRATLVNVLVDDVLADILSRIPSKHVLVLIDACHSGSATRDIALSTRSLNEAKGYGKYFVYDGMPLSGRGSSLEQTDGSELNYASIAAAEDSELAIGTAKGGVFTTGVVAAIRAAYAAGTGLTVAQLRDQVARFIEANMSRGEWHNPVASGNRALVSGGLQFVPVQATPPQGEGPTWNALVDLASKGQALTVVAGKPAYVVGDEVTFAVDVPADGFLNIVTVDAADQTTVLFPNTYHPDNHVNAGKLGIPRVDMPFKLPAQEPVGPTLVVAFLSQTRVNMLELGIEGRDSSGKIQTVFTALTPFATRAIGVVARERGFRAGLTIVDVGAKK